MDKKKNAKEPEHWLGDLDSTTRLVATSNCFVIRKLIQEEWVKRFHYTTLKSALQGYVDRTLRGSRVSGVQGDLQKLTQVIEDLNERVAKVGEELDLKWDQCASQACRAEKEALRLSRKSLARELRAQLAENEELKENIKRMGSA